PCYQYEERRDTIDIYLRRFEHCAPLYWIPEDKWNIRLALTLVGDDYGAYSNRCADDIISFRVLKSALLMRYKPTTSRYKRRLRSSQLEKKE
ncbi:unnamed protein product, partial [Lymnaea stagnalis]